MIQYLSQRFSGLVSPRPLRPTRLHAATDLPITTGGEGTLDIPIPDPTAEDRARDAWQAHGLKLARQEDWSKLAGLMRTADDGRRLTPGGMSVAELLAYGARADVVGAAEHALQEGAFDQTTPLLAGIEALETVHCEYPDNAMIAAVVTLAHMDLAWAWRGNGAAADVPAQAHAAYLAHMDRARDLITPFCDSAPASALLASTRCALARGSAETADEIARRFEALIDLNPLDTRQIRALGSILLPRWNGDYARLELEARRTGARLSPIWGAGGYTWVMLDAISADSEACAALDVAYFLDGIRDILSSRPDQFTANLLAAYCAVTMSGETGQRAADLNRATISNARGWIVCDHMTELHPLIWAHAAHGFDNALRVRSLESFARRGVTEARRVLNGIFLPELARGQTVVFTENGPVTQPTAG